MEEIIMTLGVIARLTIKEGKNDEFESVFKEMVAAVRANEPGCNFYDLHRSKEDSQSYVVLEQYADKDAMKAHSSSEHFKTIGAKMGPCMAKGADIEVMEGV